VLLVVVASVLALVQPAAAAARKTKSPAVTTTTTTAPPSTTTTTAPVTRAPLSQCSDGSAVVSQVVTPENALIAVCTSVGSWTPSAVYNLLKPNALDLAAIGPRLTIQISTGKPSSTGASASCCDAAGGYYGYRAVMSLNPSSTSSFASAPDAVLTHEYGHAWTNYWRFTNSANAGAWSAYTQFRGIANNAKLNTSYNWMDYEMAADDYRRLFGTATAQSQLAYLNSAVPDSKQVAGLASFFLDSFR
jgi:hypothetical protein